MPTDDQKEQTPSASAPPPGDYYYETTGANTTAQSTLTNRPLPPVPGQSDARGMAELDHLADGMRALQLGETRGAQIESFFLRQLSYFKGEYNGETITEWVERVELLKDLLKATDAEIIRILPLKMSSRAVEFLRGFLASRDRAEHTWTNLRRALLTQFGGKVDPTQLVSQLQQARMGRNTPVREFALQIGRLARLAYPELSSDTGTPEQAEVQKTLFNRIALEQFTAGLPPLLSRPIFERRITDFQEAVDLAAHHEDINTRFMRRSTIHAIHEEMPPYPQQGYPMTGYPYHAGPDPYLQPPQYMAPVHLSSTGNSGGPEPDFRSPQRQGHRGQRPYPRTNRSASVVCHRCKKRGHYQRECERCAICGEWGHAMADCTNIVCAACKGMGHPANHCSKNSQSRGQPRPNNNTSC